MYYDCHVHTTFSPDGKSSVDECITRIDQGIVKGIGFAEHLDFLPECGAYGYLDDAAYINKVMKLRERGYDVRAGVEIDYAACVEADILEKIKETPYDFTICSIHTIQGFSVSDRNIAHFMEKSSFYNLIAGYYDALSASLKVKKFDAIGHVGVYRRYLKRDFYDTALTKWLEELDDAAAKECAASGKILEVNTSGLFAILNETVPRRSFLQSYYTYGGRAICLSSDAHSSEHIGRGFGMAGDVLREIGFKHIYLPWDYENPIVLG